MALIWRWPNDRKYQHLVRDELDHRALCGAEVLHGTTEPRCPENRACERCIWLAERDRLQVPPVDRVSYRVEGTRGLELLV